MKKKIVLNIGYSVMSVGKWPIEWPREKNQSESSSRRRLAS